MNVANIITFFRIGFGVAMIFAVPFSPVFWILYLCGGLSDILDGMVARALKEDSEMGAKLDSIADFVFGTALSIVIIVNVQLPIWTWVCIGGIAVLRFTGYGIGAYKYHTFSALHTYSNKLVGMLLFIFPLLYKILDLKLACMLLCLTAFLSAVEEVLITVRSQELDRDGKGIWWM